MFQGTTPLDVRKVIAETTAAWPDGIDVAVACSGNFSIERAIAETNADRHFRIHGNDVSLYTSCLGTYLAGQPFHMTLNDAFRETLGFLEDGGYLDTHADQVATIMLMSRLSSTILPDGTLKPSAYYRRLYHGLVDQWPELHARTVERLENFPVRLASYTAEDAATWVQTLDDDVAVLSFPPFWGNGYAVLFRVLENAFAWDAPPYEYLEGERRDQLVRDITNRPRWVFCSDEPFESLAPFWRGVAFTTAFGKKVYMYTSDGPARIITPRQKTEMVKLPRIAPDDPIGDRLSLVQLRSGQFNALRAQYMTPDIKPASAQWAFGVLLDGKLIGAFGVTTPQSINTMRIPPYAYLMSDFAVAPSPHPRLSKLVLMAALSRESKLLIERGMNRRVVMLATTAFSDRPVSMKYRGLFKMVGRSEDNDVSTKRYKLNYASPFSDRTLDEQLAEWKRRYVQE